VKRLFDRHRHAQQRALVSARTRRIGRVSGDQRALEVAHAYRVDRGVETFDARDGSARQLADEMSRRASAVRSSVAVAHSAIIMDLSREAYTAARSSM
jgi:hypothetical protein